ncbi:SHOCT domain-containing protein [Ferranicluibacter rubi]|nr:SHOCT domain-containing protein [Ferranicluibacter rubi]TCP90962.1 putative oligomerization/nucleic acid binding protein [Rhizobium sp. PP-CC-2G-626]TCQ04731.1 putative oligomerization/nucleic acid binding protein [Rhizobium sp. PP-F2F-G36]
MKLLSGHSMLRTAAISALCATAVGCTTPQADRTPAYTSTMARPVPTNVYPRIEGKLSAAAPQMTNEEATSVSTRLSALSARRASGAISEAEYRRRLAELNALAEHHGADTLNEIRN